MAEIIQPRISNRGEEFIIVQLARQYKSPLDALREYETNALDEVEGVGNGIITTSLDPRGLCGIVTDNGRGMNEARMRELPVNIGDSLKRDKKDKRGEKAVGLWAFGSAGPQLQLISRVSGDSGYSLLRYGIEGREGSERGVTEFDRITEKDMDVFYGGFEHGTRVIMKIDKRLFAKQFKTANIKRFIQQTYTPILMKDGDIMFELETIGANDLAQVQAPKFKGEPLL